MVQIRKQLVSQDVINKRSYGKVNPVTFITVHQTGNPNKGANAEMHARLQSNLNPRQASWHYSVDDKQIVQSFPDDVRCWHASDGRGPGNTTSIAIEICINSDGDYAKAVKNAAELVKIKMKEHKLGIKHIKQHFDWYNKFCPEQLLRGHKGISWDDFINMLKSGTSTSTPPKKQTGSSTVSKPKGRAYIRKIQLKVGSPVDGIAGPDTLKKTVMFYQRALNSQFNAGLKVDGIPGPKTYAAGVTVGPIARGDITFSLQAFLCFKGVKYETDPDSIMGEDTTAKTLLFQKSYFKNKKDHDGKPGKKTFKALMQ